MSQPPQTKQSSSKPLGTGHSRATTTAQEDAGSWCWQHESHSLWQRTGEDARRKVTIPQGKLPMPCRRQTSAGHRRCVSSLIRRRVLRRPSRENGMSGDDGARQVSRVTGTRYPSIWTKDAHGGPYRKARTVLSSRAGDGERRLTRPVCTLHFRLPAVRTGTTRSRRDRTGVKSSESLVRCPLPHCLRVETRA